MLAHPESELTIEQAALFEQQLAQIRSGVPLAYVLGRQAFYGRDFQVSSATLIPRPETEQLIALALEIAADFQAGFLVADVGTGSGCIGITLACELPGITILAIDRSLEALRIAQRNARVHQVDARCRMVQAALLDPINVECMLICANLPYIPTARLKTLEVSRHEPRLALNGGPDGMLTPARSSTTWSVTSIRQARRSSRSITRMPWHSSSMPRKPYPGRAVRLKDDLSGMARFLVIGPKGS